MAELTEKDRERVREYCYDTYYHDPPCHSECCDRPIGKYVKMPLETFTDLIASVREEVIKAGTVEAWGRGADSIRSPT